MRSARILTFIMLFMSLVVGAIPTAHARDGGHGNARWDWVADTRWYVKAENLLAYASPANLAQSEPLADQTLWWIDGCENGSFSGTSWTVMWRRTPGGYIATEPAWNAMAGTISRSGDVRIEFTPTKGGDGGSTVGYGKMRRIEGRWRFEMQMGSGSSVRVAHWAYMTQFLGSEADFPAVYPPVSEASFDGSLLSDEWRPIQGTSWRVVDATLFPQGANFEIAWFRGGYFHGEGTTSGGSVLRLLGSVTPEGDVYIEFCVADSAVVARRGRIRAVGHNRFAMSWRELEGTHPVGGGFGRH